VVACAVAVILTHDQQVLFGKRRTESGGFEWQLPGGWIVAGETPQQAAPREVLEETGLEVGELHFRGVTNNIFLSSSHSISLYYEAECVNANGLLVMETENCSGWQWRDWKEATENLFLPLQLLRESDYRPF
jgi:8-oxo-dGTP pyrophosphatase MutT (NUDIX family)